MRKTAYEVIQTERVQNGHGSHVVPGLRSRWSDLRKLTWHASIIMSEHPDIRIYVYKGRYWINKRFIYGTFGIQINNHSLSPMGMDAAWTYLNGVSLGLELARDNSRKKHAL